MSGRLEGKTALVIGAGSIGPGWSNGKAAATLFAREGAKVYCVDINEEAAQETAEIIRGEGGIASAGRADAASSSEVKAIVDECLRRFGRIDVLHNNVGIVELGGVVELRGGEVGPRVQRQSEELLPGDEACPSRHGRAREADRSGQISSIALVRFLGSNYVAYYMTKAAMNHIRG